MQISAGRMAALREHIRAESEHDMVMEQALEHAPRNAYHSLVLTDPDPKLGSALLNGHTPA